MTEIYIPQINVQNDWYSELRISDQKVWASCKSKNGVKYTDLYCKGEGIISTDENFTAQFLRQHILKMESQEPKSTACFVNPRKTFSKMHKKSMNCIDISNGGGLAVTSADDGNMFVWQTIDGEIRRSLEGHINDVTHCRFFPSGEVILSGGVDMRLKIWSVEDGHCAATLVGHTGGITDTAIIDRGRNVVSCSRDGSVRLWDCGTSKCLSVIIDDLSTVVNKCCLRGYLSTCSNANVSRSDREIGTENKLLCIGCEDGRLMAVDLYSRTQIFAVQNHSSVNCCTFLNDDVIAVGLENGMIKLFDQRNTNHPFSSIHHGESRICSMRSIIGNSLVVGRGDGSCSVIKVIGESNPSVIGLTGSDCDPIYDIAVHNQVIYTACRDRHVRKYILDLNT